MSRRPRKPLPDLDHFRLDATGLWVPRNPGAPPAHALGLVIAAPQPPAGQPALLLPSSLLSLPEGFLAYATEEELGLTTLGRAAVVAELRALPAQLTVVKLADWLKRLSTIRADRAGHIALARDIYGDVEIVDRMARWAAHDEHVIFSEQALLALLCHALVHGRDDDADAFTDDEVLSLKRLLIAATGLLMRDEDLGEFDDQAPEEWLAFITQNLLFNATMNLGNGIGRTWRMFGELALDPNRHWRTPVDMGALIADVGLDVAQQLTLGFGLYGAIGIDSPAVAITPDGWRAICADVAGDDAEPNQVVSVIAATFPEMRAQLTGETAARLDPELQWASLPFLERPFLRLPDDRLLLVAPRAIEAWAVHGVHYRLLEAARTRDRRRGAQHFTAFAGEVFEEYVLELLEQEHERTRSAARVLRAQPLPGGGETCDALVVSGDDIVLIEISSRRVTAETRVTGDPGALRKDMLMLAVKRVRQLHATVEALRAGQIKALDGRQFARVFPLVVNVEPLRWTPMLHAYLRREVPGLLRQPGVQPLQFAEVEKLEALLSALARAPLATLIATKINLAGVDADFQMWLSRSPIAPSVDRPSTTDEALRRAQAAMGHVLGGPSDPDAE
jgi:hypothetical protein